jgi:hypothetical protein
LASRLIRLALLAVMPLGAASSSAHCQDDNRHPGRVGRRAVLERGFEIALAKSAAPYNVSDSATVWLFADSGYVVGARGTNGVECYVSRGWPEALEPHCFDAEGAKTILPMELRRVELLHQGKQPDVVEREIAEALAAGKFRLPRRPAMSYMMSAGQVLYSDDGRRVGRWQPHIMIYYPYLDGRDVGLATTDGKTAMVTGNGGATSSITVIVREFVEPRGVARATP